MSLKALGIAFCPLSEYFFHQSKRQRCWKLGQYISLCAGGGFGILSWKAREVVDKLLEESSPASAVRSERFFINLTVSSGIFATISIAVAALSTIFSYREAKTNEQFSTPQQYMLREFGPIHSTPSSQS